jgi:hypothetical protein
MRNMEKKGKSILEEIKVINCLISFRRNKWAKRRRRARRILCGIKSFEVNDANYTGKKLISSSLSRYFDNLN